MEPLTLRFLKKADGMTVVSYHRADGTATWLKDKSPYFAYHDLAHYAVETTLGLDRAFLGLVANGYDLSDFETKESRGPMPPDAVLAEGIAGALSLEAVTGLVQCADELNAQFAPMFAAGGHSFARPVTDDELARIRKNYSALLLRWRNLAVDAPLELPFPAAR